jgi:hypothetical protein
MAQYNTPPQPEHEGTQDPFIPPVVLIGLSMLGFVVALIVAFTQPSFGIVGYGGLAFGVLALLAWVLIAPEQARSMLTGRTVRFGGTSLIITVLLIVALAVVYVVVRNQGIRLDLTERSSYSLTDESRQAISAYAADPTLPNVQMFAFYTQNMGGSRDRVVALFDDYRAASGQKINYEFVDPDRNPQQAQTYSITTPGQIAVARVNADGSFDVENAVVVSNAIQEDLTNAVLRVAANGQFAAYFLNVRDGYADNMSLLQTGLADRFDWNVVQESLVALTAPGGEVRLNDPNLDGEVMVIPGGSAALSEQELDILTNYLESGGDLIIYAGSNLTNEERASLATSENLNAYLRENFGLSFTPDVMLDPVQAYQSPELPIYNNLDTQAYITTSNIQRGQGLLLFQLPNPITIAETAPENVTTLALSRSSESAYTISDLDRFFSGTPEEVSAAIQQQEGDATGPFVLAAQAENTATGARVVLVSSVTVGLDEFAQLNVDNFTVAFNSVVWATDFNNFVSEITIPQQQRPQDVPLFAEEQTLRNISFLTTVVLPFGILIIGVLVWWNGRQRLKN